MKFRKRDFWQDLADDYNAMLAKLGALKDEESETADDEKLVESK